MSIRHYRLRCQACHRIFEDDGFILMCPEPHKPSLLVTEYQERRFEPDTHADGIFRYRKWLPSTRVLRGSGSNVTYQSERLNRVVGLPNLWIVFNGYWPEKGATLQTTTFKDLEAWTVLSRLPDQHKGVLVIASAGNTAAAFASACSMTKVPCLLIIPETGLANLQFPHALDPCVKIVCLGGSADYFDAITLASRVSVLEGFFPEGGVKNVARRDGLGTAILNAVEQIGQIPNYYFQAIGSGAGAIAVYEASQRLIDDGRYGNKSPRLMLSQNLPFVPIYLSWKSGRRELIQIDSDEARTLIQQVTAPVLSNRRPPYSDRGGVFDVLTATQGDMLVADNLEACHAAKLFEDIEGIDIDPASAVAFATLLKAARYNGMRQEDVVLLNVTAGGRNKQRRNEQFIPAQPVAVVDRTDILLDETLENIVALFR